MKDLTTPQAVLVGAFLIALAILYSNGALRLSGVDWKNTKFGNSVADKTIQPNPTPATLKPVDIGNLPIQGNKNAKVTLIEFADFQCPFCGAVTGLSPNNPVASQLKGQDPTWSPYLPGIMEDYIKTGKAKFAYRDFAFLGAESNDAANAARCANDQGKFWEYHDKIFSNQSGENKGTFSKDNLKKFGVELGLDIPKFNDCVDKNTHQSEVSADTSAGRAAGVNGTPTLFVNGRPVSGAVGYLQVKQIIEEALKGN